ncbi:MAG TPA: TIGR03790 family protein [Candidatus Paceibacterota bacterium]
MRRTSIRFARASAAFLLLSLTIFPSLLRASSSTLPVFLDQIAAPKTGTDVLAFMGEAVKLALDSSGNLYVADGVLSQVRKYDSSGNFLLEFGNAGTGDGQFGTTFGGIAIGPSGDIYIVDGDNSCIEKFDASGNFVTKWGSSGSGDGQFGTNVRGIAVSPSGDVYVSDGSNNRIQKFDSSGNFITKWGSAGSGDGQFSSLSGIGVDSNGNIFVADSGNVRIQVFDSSGTYITQWADYFALSLYIDPSDNVYIGDIVTNKIIKLDLAGNVITSWSFVGVMNIVADSSVLYVSNTTQATYSKYTTSGSLVNRYISSGSGDGMFKTPYGTAFDSLGNFYVVDSSNSRIQKFDSSGNFVSKFGSAGTGNGQFSTAVGIAIDSLDNIYVAEYGNKRIQKFDSSGSFVTKWGSAGSGDGQFQPVFTNGINYFPIAVDTAGNVYVGDPNNKRIQKFDSSGNFITKWGSIGSGNGQFSIGGGLAYISGIATDSLNNVYVVDSGNKRIQKFDSSGTYITQWGSSGTGDGQFTTAYAIAVDADNNIYVTDTGSKRIQKFDSSGNFLAKWGIPGVDDNEYHLPSGIAVSSDGMIAITDRGLNRVSLLLNDTTGPSVSITSPTTGATVSGVTTVSVTATDEDSVSGVSLYVDSEALGSEDVSSPYEFDWDTSSATFGSHTLYVVTHDPSGNYATSTSITVTVGEAVSAPSVGSLSASNVTSSAASISASITNSGNASSTEAGFDYGTTESYGTTASTTGSFGLGSTFSTNLSGLVCATTYHYRAFAVNTGGTGTSSDATFTTSACPDQTDFPSISYTSATNLTSTSTMFTGVLSGFGIASTTAVGFQYGSTAAYGSTIQTSGSIDLGPFFKTAAGLSCATTYHYRAFATNSLGTGYSSDKTFTTPPCVTAYGSSRQDYFGYSDVLLVVNDNSATSTAIGDYFKASRGIDDAYVVHTSYGGDDHISRSDFESLVLAPIKSFIESNGLNINYVVLTKGVPMVVTDYTNSVDSELAYCLGRSSCPTYSGAFNPYLGSIGPISSGVTGIYGVTRLDGYTLSDIYGLIDRSHNATTTSAGTFVLDVDPNKGGGYDIFNQWLKAAAPILEGRGFDVTLDQTSTFLTGQTNVLGYSSWGSNDSSPALYGKPGNTYVNGAIAETAVSTSGRSFGYPPVYGQSLIADLIAEGVSGAKGYVSEPFLNAVAHPDILFDHYTAGFNLADSFYSASERIKWKDVVVGDPKTNIRGAFMSPKPILPVSGYGTTTSMNLAFLWPQAAVYDQSPVEYDLYIDGSLYQDGITDPGYNLTSSLSVGSHTWSVRAYKDSALIGSTTPTVFTITGYPSDFSLVSPESGTTTTDMTPTFSWTESTDTSGISKYQLYIDGQLVKDGIHGTSTTVTAPLSFGSHAWYVRAVNALDAVRSSASSVFTVGDENDVALIISPFSVTSVGTSSASFTWSTNRAASTQIEFGPLSSYGSTTPLADSVVLVTDHTDSIQGLAPCTVYHYRAKSVDGSDVEGVSSDRVLSTLGCVGDADLFLTEEASIARSTGGTISVTGAFGGSIVATVPANFISSDASLAFQAKNIDSAKFFAAAGLPTGKEKVGNKVFNLRALSGTSDFVSSFDKPIEISMSYDESDIGELDESTFVIYRYHDSAWTALDDCSVDTNDKVVTCTTTGFSDFVLVGNTGTGSDGDQEETELTPNSDNEASSQASTPARKNGSSHRVSMITQKTITSSAVAPIAALLNGKTEAVKALQRVLVFAGLLPGSLVNGQLDSKTIEALQSYLVSPAQKVPSFSRDLSIGVLSDEVVRLQAFLNAQGYSVAVSGPGSVGQETRFFGPSTQAALKKFQKANGLPSTGYFGPLTRSLIQSGSFVAE